MFRRLFFIIIAVLSIVNSKAQRNKLAPTPPMGYMTWNFYADQITEKDVRTIADAMVANGLVDAGYNYIFIDDGWQGGRDKKNNIIPDPVKFPSGIKALVDYVHLKGLKLGIYSDAAPLTCAGYTASYHFEEQDAGTFAGWGIDYLKYDYCNAPPDMETAKIRYKSIADALTHSGRNMVLGICEWGDRQPWLWGRSVGGSLWRIAGDIRDKWSSENDSLNIEKGGVGIMDAIRADADIAGFAGDGGWNDPDMLMVGLYGHKGPSSDLGGIGCTDVEYQSNMSLWCLLAAPLMVSCDVANMNEATKRILTNKNILAIDQDKLGKQAVRKINNNGWQVFVKPLENNETAIGILNTGKKAGKFETDLATLGLEGKYTTLNIWNNEIKKNQKKLSYTVGSHETVVLRLNNPDMPKVMSTK